MTSSVSHASATLDYKPPFWRELMNTTVGYVAWGYGALLFSFVAYGSYISFKWLAVKNSVFVSDFLFFLFGSLLGYLLKSVTALAAWHEIRVRLRAWRRNEPDGQEKRLSPDKGA